MTNTANSPAVPEPWHAFAAADVVNRLATDATSGLSSQQARERLAHVGSNRLRQAASTPWWKRFFRQFSELIVLILILAALIAGALGEWLDAAAILAIVTLNGVLGFLQEEKAQRDLASLSKQAAYTAKAIRDGRQVVVSAEDLVPGDVIELEAGDHIPADARLGESFTFGAEESALTGESVPVYKDATTILPASTSLADRRNMAYVGTIAVSGRATAVVVATAMRTELGRIAGQLAKQPAEPTPLQKHLNEFGQKLLVVCLVFVAIIFALQMAHGSNRTRRFLRPSAWPSPLFLRVCQTLSRSS